MLGHYVPSVLSGFKLDALGPWHNMLLCSQEHSAVSTVHVLFIAFDITIFIFPGSRFIPFLILECWYLPNVDIIFFFISFPLNTYLAFSSQHVSTLTFLPVNKWTLLYTTPLGVCVGHEDHCVRLQVRFRDVNIQELMAWFRRVFSSPEHLNLLLVLSSGFIQMRMPSSVCIRVYLRVCVYLLTE